MTMPIAILDACVLYPATLRDTLLQAGQKNLYRMQWTEMILEEMRRNLVKNGKANEAQAQRLVNIMQSTFPRAQVLEDFAGLIETMTNHPKDRHVLAAAVASGANLIITFNLKDFPQSALAPYGVEAQSPDNFLLHLLDTYQQSMLAVLREQAQDLRQPPHTVADVLRSLDIHAPHFAARVRQLLAL